MARSVGQHAAGPPGKGPVYVGLPLRYMGVSVRTVQGSHTKSSPLLPLGLTSSSCPRVGLLLDLQGTCQLSQWGLEMAQSLSRGYIDMGIWPYAQPAYPVNDKRGRYNFLGSQKALGKK